MLGIFDSGLGGLTALKEIRSLLPNEELVYFGDTGRVPYGSRSKDTIISYAMQDVSFLMSFAPRAIVCACGTVSTTALDVLRRSFSVPIIGVVEGAVEKAVSVSKNKKIAVIGTQATVKSGCFERAIRTICPDAEVISVACPLFVPLVENGFIAPEEPITHLVCRRYLEGVAESGADTIILGCTHYPIIASHIAAALQGVTLVNTGMEAARKICELFPPADTQTPASRPLTHYYVSDDASLFESTASVFLGEDVEGNVKQVNISQIVPHITLGSLDTKGI